MDIWLIVDGALLLVLVIALLRRERLAGRFQIVSMIVCGLLVASCLVQSMIDGPRVWTLGLAALAIVFFGIEVSRQIRSRREHERGVP